MQVWNNALLCVPSESSALVESMQVLLTVELGRIRMSVQELLEMSSIGQMRLAFDHKTVVTLRLGEEEIAEGVFVVEGGELVLEIESVKF